MANLVRLVTLVMTLIMMAPGVISLAYDSDEIVEFTSSFLGLTICFPLLIAFVYVADEIESID